MKIERYIKFYRDKKDAKSRIHHNTSEIDEEIKRNGMLMKYQDKFIYELYHDGKVQEVLFEVTRKDGSTLKTTGWSVDLPEIEKGDSTKVEIKSITKIPKK